MAIKRELSAKLLAWYDVNARILPWRIGPAEKREGAISDPYAVWLSEIMLQQTTTETVKNYFPKFISRWPTIFELAAADDSEVLAEWAGLGYYARARRLIKCARLIVDQLGGVFPNEKEGLLSLPGIGPYTAAAIAAIAFDRQETVVDGNVERVMARLHAARMPLAKAKRELRTRAGELTPAERPGDYAQAVMDLGATICRPRSPKCDILPLADCLHGIFGRAAERDSPQDSEISEAGSPGHCLCRHAAGRCVAFGKKAR